MAKSAADSEPYWQASMPSHFSTTEPTIGQAFENAISAADRIPYDKTNITTPK